MSEVKSSPGDKYATPAGEDIPTKKITTNDITAPQETAENSSGNRNSVRKVKCMSQKFRAPM